MGAAAGGDGGGELGGGKGFMMGREQPKEPTVISNSDKPRRRETAKHFIFTLFTVVLL